MKGNGDFSIGHEVWPGTSKLLEEMGELQQVLGKLIGAHGQEGHWDGSNLRQRLVEEIADVTAAIAFFGETNLTEEERLQVMERVYKKITLFQQWHQGVDQQLVADEPLVDETDQDTPPTHPKTHRNAATGKEHDYHQVWTPYGYCCSCELGSPDDGCTT